MIIENRIHLATKDAIGREKNQINILHFSVFDTTKLTPCIPFCYRVYNSLTCSCRFDVANVLLNPAIAATPATDARNIPAFETKGNVQYLMIQSPTKTGI